ncbi:MAG: hypothetical protein WC145_06445 [Aliarcobacter sp.]
MALTGPDLAILGIADRWAYQKELAVQVCEGGTDVWTRVDAAQDEPFENRVKGQAATDLDAAFLAAPYGQWPTMQAFLALLRAYVVTDLGYADLSSYFLGRRVRIDLRAAEIFQEWAGPHVLAPAAIHARADAGEGAPGLLLGSLEYGEEFVSGSSIDLARTSESAVLARVTAIGADDWTLTITCVRADNSTEELTEVINGTGDGGAVGDTYVLGAEALNGTAAAEQKIVPVAATAQFAVGQKVLVTQWTGDPPNEVWLAQEVATIATIQENTSLTMGENLLHDYTTAGFVYPLWIAVADCGESGGESEDAVEFYPAADRRLKL